MRLFLFSLLFALAFTVPAVSLAAPLVASDIRSPVITRKVETLASLKSLSKSHSIQSVYVEGRATPGDGYGGVFYWVSGNQSANPLVVDDTEEGRFVKPTTPGDGSTGVWARQYDGPVNLKWFGAVGDGSDSTAAIIAAVKTGEPLLIPRGVFGISAPISFSQKIVGSGMDEGQTEIVLSGTGTFQPNDWYAGLENLLLRSGTNNLVYVTINGMSYGTYKNLRFKKEGAATAQRGFTFDTTVASIYFTAVDNCYFNGVAYPYFITGNTTQVFNANKLGGLATNYCQNFDSAITIQNQLAADGNEFKGYFETGTNVVTILVNSFSQNRINIVQDNVTNTVDSTGATVTGVNTWEILAGGFNVLGVYPQNQILIGPKKTLVRATNSLADSIPNAAATTLKYNTEAFDLLGEFSNGAGLFTAKNAGYYRVTAQALSASASWTAGQRWEIRVYKNGVEYAKGDWTVSSGAVTTNQSSKVSALVLMNGTTDSVDVRLIHNQGGSVSLDTSPVGNYIEIERVDFN